MKKTIVLIILLFGSLTLMAQNMPDNINVSGVYKYTISPEYSAKMILSLSNVYYDMETLNLAEIKSTYFDKLAKAGIPSNRLKEDDLSYAMMGYDKDGTVIEFKSNSLEEIKKFLTVKSIGVTKSDTLLEASLTDVQMADYAKAAFDQAKQKAEAIAKNIGRTIGKAIYISDTNTNKISESLYYGSPVNSRDYYISVSFEML